MEYFYKDKFETECAIRTLKEMDRERIEKYKKSDKILDLHTHTTFSDGELPPFTLINQAIDKNIGILAITDHDTIDGLIDLKKDKSAKNIINKAGIKTINGTELSAYAKTGIIHILGLDILLQNEDLIKAMEKRKQMRFYRMIAMLELLKRKYNIAFSSKNILELLNDPHKYNRPSLAQLLIKKNYVNTVNEAFEKYLTEIHNMINEDYKDPSYEDCIKLILNAGGIPVLAHPKTLKLNNEKFIKLLEDLIDVGLMGIEVYHSSHTKDEIAYYISVAEKYNLLISGGSDFHGPNIKPDIELGSGKNNNLNIKMLSIINRLH